MPGGGKETHMAWNLHPDTDRENSYLSINLYTIDANQPGFDLRELHERGMIEYLDWLGESGKRGDVPHPGGLY
jgi:hypothetical protein